MDRKGTLFVISGPSGVGKGTIKELLLARIPDLKSSISATTRKARPGEIDGRDYFFLSNDDFNKMISEGEFLEFAKVYSNFYGTPAKFVTENLRGGHDVLLEIDIQGARQVKEKLPQGIFIFIQPPSFEELVSRLKLRGKDSRESIKRRLLASREEMAQIKFYDYIVTNDDLEEAVAKVQSIIYAERCRVKNYF